MKKLTWKDALAPIKNSDFFKDLTAKVNREYAEHKCFPPKSEIYRALQLTELGDVKVVILGQDPYHNDGQANGLCFSVHEDVKAPPSLRNIFIELKDDLNVDRTEKDLSDWAEQGILLLNATLTVRAHQPNSHKDLGWETFTDEIIRQVSNNLENVVFVLWGAFAQKKAALIDEQRHHILKSAHPSPFSVHRGFFGSKPFSAINRFLESVGERPIEWQDY